MAFPATDLLWTLLKARDVIATYGTDAGIDRSSALWPKLDRYGIAGSDVALGGILAAVPRAG